MGCADKDELIIWRIYDKTNQTPADECIKVTTFEDMYLQLKKLFRINEFSPSSCYFDCETCQYQLETWDSHAGKFVRIKKFIFNRGIQNWRRVIFSNGRVLTLTGDHPLPVVTKGRTFVDDLVIGDAVPLTASYPEATLAVSHKLPSDWRFYWMLGMTLCDASIEKSNITYSVGADETDLRDKILEFGDVFINELARMEDNFIPQSVDKRWLLQARGARGTYFDVIFTGVRPAVSKLYRMFNGALKINRKIPAELFLNISKENRLALLAGMLDADGYINDSRPNSRIQLGSTNKALALMQATLAEIVGCQAKVYINHYDSSDKEKLRYRVEFFVPEELVKFIQCQKKKEHLGTFAGTPVNTQTCAVMSIEKLPYQPFLMSFDVETESDRFDLSMIQSHNCRTRVLGNTFDPDNAVAPGRGNLFPITTNLPYLALEVKEALKEGEDLYTKFNEALDKRVDDILQMLADRFEVVAKKKAKNFPFAMGQHLYIGSENLGPNDEIREVIKHGTLVVGFIGLAETLVALTGKHHGESEESWKMGLEIIGRMNDRVAARAKETTMNYSFMASPAEGCCGRLLQCTRKRFGVIPGITDRAYLSNSFHKQECGL